jgi:hypothetical protein
MPLACQPDDGIPTTPSPPLACTFVKSRACLASSDCAPGCQCQCGVCNCDVTASPEPCQSDTDCVSKGEGLSCIQGSCATEQLRPWIGSWQGQFAQTFANYEATCEAGIVTQLGPATGSGRYSFQLLGNGSQLIFQAQASGTPKCALPLILSDNTASFVPGSACVVAGLGNLCTLTGTLPIALDTLLGGVATLDGGTVSLQTTDVLAMPQQQGPECGTVPAGMTQLTVGSLTATAQRVAPDAG